LNIFSLFNNKAKLILRGRKECFGILKEKIKDEDKIVWFHVSSLGELEQAKPLIECFKERFPGFKILLSIFSSSAQKAAFSYNGVDIAVYMKGDSIYNAKKFIEYAHPSLVFFIKYEFWFNHIIEASKKGANIYYVSLILRKGQYFFSPFSFWFQKQLRRINYFFVQDEKTQSLLKKIGIENTLVTGDTRFDRVAEIANKVKDFPIIKNFINEEKVILLGSSWQKDEKLFKEAIGKINTKFKLIIVPHQIEVSHINYIKKLFPKAILYSDIFNTSYTNITNTDKILVIDSIGILSSLYQYATIAYIGGGFGKGIHNILEAAIYSKPIVFGKKYNKFKEAKDLLEEKGAFSVRDSRELTNILNTLFLNENFYNNACNSNTKYVEENIGSSEKIIKKIENII
jgi:3-deoxy-D-manno-octulosonic-acid transferase